MKRVDITEEQLKEAEDWLNQIECDKTDLPLLLASYGNDVNECSFPAINNISTEIANLTKIIHRTFNKQRIPVGDFDGLFKRIDQRKHSTYTRYGFDQIIHSLLSLGWEIIEIKTYRYWFKRYEIYYLKL